MNSAQLVSLLTLGLGSLTGWLANSGRMDKSTGDAITAGLIAFVTWALAHWFHGSTTTAAATTSPTPPASKVSAFLLVGALAWALAFSSGCATATGNAYKAEAATDATVTAAMTAWGDYVAQNHPSAAVEQQVATAFANYQQAELLAIDATAAYAAMSSTNSAASTANMVAASASVANAMTDLTQLLTNLGVKF